MNTQFKIRGVVREKESGIAIGNLMVKAFDRDLLFDDLLGSAFTRPDGTFEIMTEAEDFRDFFEKRPDIYLKILTPDAQRQIYSTEHAVRWEAAHVEYYEVDIPAEALGELTPHTQGRELLFVHDDTRLTLLQAPLSEYGRQQYFRWLFPEDFPGDTQAPVPDIAITFVVPPGSVAPDTLSTIKGVVTESIRRLMMLGPGEIIPEVKIEEVSPGQVNIAFWLDPSLPEDQRLQVLRAFNVSSGSLFGIGITRQLVEMLTDRRFTVGPKIVEGGTAELRSASVTLEAPDKIIFSLSGVQHRTIISTDFVMTRVEKLLPNLKCLPTVTTDVDERPLAALLVFAPFLSGIPSLAVKIGIEAAVAFFGLGGTSTEPEDSQFIGGLPRKVLTSDGKILIEYTNQPEVTEGGIHLTGNLRRAEREPKVTMVGKFLIQVSPGVGPISVLQSFGAVPDELVGEVTYTWSADGKVRAGQGRQAALIEFMIDNLEESEVVRRSVRVQAKEANGKFSAVRNATVTIYASSQRLPLPQPPRPIIPTS